MNAQPIPLTALVAPGQEVDVSVQFKAPATPGEYTLYWQMVNSKGIPFGHERFHPHRKDRCPIALHHSSKLIKEKARQLGFVLAGVTSCEPPANFDVFQTWLDENHHATMDYLASERSRSRRADPSLILPECKSILVLALPYSQTEGEMQKSEFKIAAYALGDDYHEVIPPRLQEIVQFIEEQVGHPIPNRYYTDTGPILERELAQRAGLGWIGKNSMLINPQAGSTFLLAEILLGIELEPDDPFTTDHCGTCTRCIDACPTNASSPTAPSTHAAASPSSPSKTKATFPKTCVRLCKTGSLDATSASRSARGIASPCPQRILP